MPRTFHFLAISNNLLVCPFKVPLKAFKALAGGEAKCIVRTLFRLALPNVITVFPDKAAFEASVAFTERPGHGIRRTLFHHTLAFPILVLVAPRQFALISALISHPTLTGRVVVRILWTRNQLTSAPRIRAPVIFCRPPEANFAFAWLNTSNNT